MIGIEIHSYETSLALSSQLLIRYDQRRIYGKTLSKDIISVRDDKSIGTL